MDVKFRSGFLRAAKVLVLVAGALALIWAVWTWRVVVVHVGMFAVLSIIRTVTNGMLVVGAVYLLGGLLPWAISRYVLEGFSPPRLPHRLWMYTPYALVGVGLLLTPVHLRTNAKITKAVQPVAERFHVEAVCYEDYCSVPEGILRQRDRIVRTHGGTRLGNWWVGGSWRYGDDAGTHTDAIYLWSAPYVF